MKILTDKEKFEMANDIDFYDAMCGFIDGVNPLQRNPLQMIKDRIRLIESLEKKGFYITKKVSKKEATTLP